MQVINEVESVVQVRVEDVRVQEVEKYIEKPVVRDVLREVEKIVPYHSEVIKEVKTL